MNRHGSLSGMSQVTDPVAMRRLLQRGLPRYSAGELQITDLRVRRARYKPGRCGWIHYSLQVEEQSTKRSGRQLLLGRIHLNGQHDPIADNATAVSEPEFAPAYFELPQLNMELWGFPNDPKLVDLYRLQDCGFLTQLIQQHRGKLPAGAIEICSAELVRYIPLKRCTMRHQLKVNGTVKGTVYSKMLTRKKSAKAIFKTMRSLWRSPICRSGKIVVPKPLCFDERMNVLFVRGLRGVRLYDQRAKIDLDALSAEIGTALAGIHQCKIESLARRPASTETIRKVLKAEKILGGCDGNTRRHVSSLKSTLLERQDDLPRIALTPTHGAFRISQLMFHRGKLALLDFDGYQLGNPISDVGSFAAHLLYLPLIGRLSAIRSRSAVSHFCRAYAAAAPWGLPQQVLSWEIAASLIGKHTKNCVAKVKSSSNQRIDQLLDLTSEVLAERTTWI